MTVWTCATCGIEHPDTADAVEAVSDLGGLSLVSASHPHLTGASIQWSHAFGRVPVLVASADRQWIRRPDSVIELWAGTREVLPGLTFVQCGGHFAGGYVAGRLARFDGGRQGMGVWALGLVVTIIAVVVGAVFGSDYDVFERVNLPSIPVPTDSLTWGGIITLAGVLVGTIISAVLGGKLGQRYHSKIDRTTI